MQPGMGVRWGHTLPKTEVTPPLPIEQTVADLGFFRGGDFGNPTSTEGSYPVNEWLF